MRKICDNDWPPYFILLIVFAAFLVASLVGCNATTTVSTTTSVPTITLVPPTLTPTQKPSSTPTATPSKGTVTVSPTKGPTETPSIILTPAVITRDNVANLTSLANLNMFAVYDVAWSPEANSFALVGYEEKDNWGIYLYSVDTLEQRWSGTTPNIDHVEFSPDGEFIVSSSGGLALWDAVTGESIRDEWFQTHSLVLVKFLPNGQEIITGISSPDSQVTLIHKWDLRAFQSSELFNHEGWLVDLELSPDGRILATGLLNEWGQVILWDILTKEQLCRFDNGVSVALNPSKDIVAVYHSEEKVILWDTKTCGFLKEINEKINDYTLTFSSDGEMLAFGSLDEDEGIQIWDQETAEKLHTIKRDHVVLLISFSPDDRYLLSVSRDDANGVVVDLWGVRP